MVLLQYDDLF